TNADRRAPATSEPEPSPHPVQSTTYNDTKRHARRINWANVPALCALGVVLAAMLIVGWRSHGQPHAPVVAVGRIRDLTVTDTATAAGSVLSDMLASSLVRIRELQVVAGSRMLELTSRSADTSRAAVMTAARRAGATELLEGEVISLADRRLRLDIR